jgi:hypothetical protein
MKINIVIHPDTPKGSAEPVMEKLRDIGFEESTDADGAATMNFDGDIGVNDLVYAAAMAKSLLSGRK